MVWSKICILTTQCTHKPHRSPTIHFSGRYLNPPRVSWFYIWLFICMIHTINSKYPPGCMSRELLISPHFCFLAFICETLLFVPFFWSMFAPLKLVLGPAINPTFSKSPIRRKAAPRNPSPTRASVSEPWSITATTGRAFNANNLKSGWHFFGSSKIQSRKFLGCRHNTQRIVKCHHKCNQWLWPGLSTNVPESDPLFCFSDFSLWIVNPDLIHNSV